MKKLSAWVVMLALVMAVSAPLLAGEQAKADLNVKMSVKGMTCATCVAGVKAALEKVDGVKSAEVSLADNEATVVYVKGKTTPEALVKAVQKAGFQASLKDPKAGA